MIDQTALDNLRSRYSHVHPLIFHRSMEKSVTAGELFDILDTFPDKYPVFWNDDTHRWEYTKDLTLSTRFEFDIAR